LLQKATMKKIQARFNHNCPQPEAFFVAPGDVGSPAGDPSSFAQKCNNESPRISNILSEGWGLVRVVLLTVG
jgi:hypothetical protein